MTDLEKLLVDKLEKEKDLLWAENQRYKTENAALRAELETQRQRVTAAVSCLNFLEKDKERLDLLNTLRQYYSRPPLRKVSGWAWSIVDEREERTGDIRDTIDAIQNKTENDKITYHKGPEFMASGVAVVHTFKT